MRAKFENYVFLIFLFYFFILFVFLLFKIFYFVYNCLLTTLLNLYIFKFFKTDFVCVNFYLFFIFLGLGKPLVWARQERDAKTELEMQAAR